MEIPDIGVDIFSGLSLQQAMRLESVRKTGIDYLFLAGSINIPSISKSIFKRLAASLASWISLKGPAITR
jgi:hypothetical protein